MTLSILRLVTIHRTILGFNNPESEEPASSAFLTVFSILSNTYRNHQYKLWFICYLAFNSDLTKSDMLGKEFNDAAKFQPYMTILIQDKICNTDLSNAPAPNHLFTISLVNLVTGPGRENTQIMLISK